MGREALYGERVPLAFSSERDSRDSAFGNLEIGLASLLEPILPEN
jgi:hypothetical protein